MLRTRTLISGIDPVISRRTDNPLIRGMERSSSTRSGFCFFDPPDGLQAVLGFADDFVFRTGGQNSLEAFPEQPVILDDEELLLRFHGGNLPARIAYIFGRLY